MALTALEEAQLNVANGALVRLGAKKIALLTEDTDRARLCNQFLVSVRKQTLRAHPWNCALQRTMFNTFPNASIQAAALTGEGILFTTTLDTFVEGRDEGSLLKQNGNSGQARITSVESATEVLADIETAWTTLVAVPTREWRIAPPWEWPYRYLKPADYLRAAKVQSTSGLGPGITASVGAGFTWSWWARGQQDNSPEPFKIEGKTLVSYQGPKLFVQYVRDLADPRDWDDLLAEAIESMLAFRISYGVTGSLAAGKTHHDAWKECLAEARSIDGQEGTGDDTGSDVLIAVRG